VSHFNTGASSADTGFVHFGSVEGLVSIPRGTPLRVPLGGPGAGDRIERLVGGAREPCRPARCSVDSRSRPGDIIALEFCVLDFAETPHEYAYRLKPDDGWTSLGRRRQVTFVGLATGRYRFEVRGRDAFGSWSTSPSARVPGVPPFWMTLWFRGLVLAAVAALVLALHLARLRSLRLRKRRARAARGAARAGARARETQPGRARGGSRRPASN